MTSAVPPIDERAAFTRISAGGSLGPGFRAARWLALLLPAALLAGAWTSQLWGGLVPCEMCLWQRWPHYAAVVIAAVAFLAPMKRAWVALAAVAIACSGVIGIYHAGVEWKWWEGATACTSLIGGKGLSTDEMLRQIMASPIVRCDTAQWRLFGISLAGYNAILSLAGTGTIGWLLRRGDAA